MSTLPKVTLPPEAAELGEVRASCDSRESGMIHYIVIGVICVLLGIAAFFVPEFIEGKTPQDEQGARVMFAVFGVLLIVVGLVMSLAVLLVTPHAIFLMDNGVVWATQKKSKMVPWNKISKVQVFEFYEHRFADPKLNVIIHAGDVGKLRFSTHYAGEPEQVLEGISAEVENVEFKPFQP